MAEVVKALLLQRGLLWLRLNWCLLDHNLILVSLQRVRLRHILVNEHTLRVISPEDLFGPFNTKYMRFNILHKVSWPKNLGVDKWRQLRL